jgi:hypothetical protein
MGVLRWLVLAALGLAGCAWAQDTTSDLTITLEGFDYGPDGQNFGVTPNVVVPGDLSPCLPAGDLCGDPSIRTANGGDATDENGPFTFTANADGDYDFQNVSGTTWNDLEITFTLQGDETNPLEQFICDGGNVFQNCGFMDPPNTIEVYFYNPYTPGGGITSSTPEPAAWPLLLMACAAMAITVARKRFATVSSAETRR